MSSEKSKSKAVRRSSVDSTVIRPVDPNASSKGNQVRAADQVDSNQIAQFVTTIKNAEEQVGEHIIQALQHTNTVAVLTTVAVGPDGQQRVISAALSPERMQQVQEILTTAEEERVDEEPCVGFHCFVTPKEASDPSTP
ncbi:MAG: hypothetical protein ACR2NZ_21980 [Rubripirellula sp.]